MSIGPLEMLGIVVSRFCMAECGHCGSAAGPERTERIARPTLGRALRSADAAGVQRVAFTGGEPLAHRALTLEGIGLANELGMHTTVCTNAFWATDAGAASDLLDQLAGAGLDRIQLSTDRWHIEYVPVEHVVRAAELSAARALEVQVAIPAGRADWAALDLLARFGHIGDIEVFTHPAHAVGRGEFLAPGVLQSATPRLEGCHLAGHHEVDVDGRVSICPTSADFADTSVLRAGDATVDDLADLLAVSAARPLPRVIATWGPLAVARLAGWSDDTPDRYAHDCQLCRALHEDGDAIDAVRERHGIDLLAPVDDATMAEMLSAIAQRLAETSVAIRC